MACTLLRLGRRAGQRCTIDGPAYPKLLQGVKQECGDTIEVSHVESAGASWVRRGRRLRRSLSPDLVHLHLATPGLSSLGWLIAGQTPVTATFHLLPAQERWSKDYIFPVGSRRVLACYARLQRRLRYVAVSDADRRQLQLRFPYAAVRLVSNVPPLPPENQPDEPPLGFGEGSLRLLSVGRLQYQKGLDRLISVLAHPLVRPLPWHWVIVGEGEERPALDALVREHDLHTKVTFVGARPAHSLFAQADLVLCPSRFEGMPLVPLEAQLAGTPVALSDIPAHREAFRGVAAAFLPQRYDDWASWLGSLLSSRGAIAALQQSQQSLRERHPHQRFFEEYEQIYNELLADDNTPAPS